MFTDAVQPLQGWCGDFGGRPGVRVATQGDVGGLLRSHPNNFHQTHTGFNIKAQGRAAHPGITCSFQLFAPPR